MNKPTNPKEVSEHVVVHFKVLKKNYITNKIYQEKRWWYQVHTELRELGIKNKMRPTDLHSLTLLGTLIPMYALSIPKSYPNRYRYSRVWINDTNIDWSSGRILHKTFHNVNHQGF